jgi:hypothetical protein
MVQENPILSEMEMKFELVTKAELEMELKGIKR